MAPELALNALKNLPRGSTVLDPMVGSGTVLRHAVNLGHNGVGFDSDPLAVLMSRSWTTEISAATVREEYEHLIDYAATVDLRREKLPWIADDPETENFIHYWFARDQRRALSRLALALHMRRQRRLGDRRSSALDLLSVALSRIIVTKDQGASLARDVSHSRPHKVADESTYDVNEGFRRSVETLLGRMAGQVSGKAEVRRGDAREIPLASGSVDAVITSPPYLNAIDYMRGHRLALVWLGFKVRELRKIRGDSIGSERGGQPTAGNVRQVSEAMFVGKGLPSRFQAMIERYANDLYLMSSEIGRVLRPGGVATLVVGNSCLKGSFVRNSDGVRTAGQLSGLRVLHESERELPTNSRYLPITSKGSLSKRMRTETILTFGKS
jgi:hypothetical protein